MASYAKYGRIREKIDQNLCVQAIRSHINTNVLRMVTFQRECFLSDIKYLGTYVCVKSRDNIFLKFKMRETSTHFEPGI